MRLRLVLLSVALLLISTGYWLFYQWANEPVSKSVTTSSHPKPTTTAPQQIKTHFFTTVVPGIFRVQIANNSANPDVVQVTGFEAQGGTVQIGITSALLPNNTLSDIADYSFRLKRTDLYETVPTIGFTGETVTFRKRTGDEITSFIVSGNRYASIAISGQSATDHEYTDLRIQIAKNWQWL